jgi:hypothetical protein
VQDPGPGKPAGKKENKTPKTRTEGQELKSYLTKVAGKITESKGWSQKMIDNGTPLVLHHVISVAVAMYHVHVCCRP